MATKELTYFVCVRVHVCRFLNKWNKPTSTVSVYIYLPVYLFIEITVGWSVCLSIHPSIHLKCEHGIN